MLTIDEIHTGSTSILEQIGIDWIQNRLDPDTIFRITIPEDEGRTETYLNYLIFNGDIERVSSLDTPQVVSGWRLTTKGKLRTLQLNQAGKSLPKATPAPSSGRSC